VTPEESIRTFDIALGEFIEGKPRQTLSERLFRPRHADQANLGQILSGDRVDLGVANERESVYGLSVATSLLEQRVGLAVLFGVVRAVQDRKLGDKALDRRIGPCFVLSERGLPISADVDACLGK
jgi:hypothetical protein